MPNFRGRKHFQCDATQEMSSFGAQLAQNAWKLIIVNHFPLQLLHFKLIMIICDVFIFLDLTLLFFRHVLHKIALTDHFIDIFTDEKVDHIVALCDVSVIYV